MKDEGGRMKIVRYTLMAIFLAMVISACSLDLSQSATPGFATATLPPLPTGENATAASPGLSIPVTWGGLGLTGKLIYTSAQQDGNTPSMDIRLLDLTTGAITVLFHTPPAGILYSVTVSPDAKQIIFAYSLPPGTNQGAYQQLYQMPVDASKAPELLFAPPTPDDQYIQPEWSPDGKTIYFAHVNYQRPPEKGQHYPFFELYRMTYPSGVPEKLMDKAYWPRLSPDMSRLAYITMDPATGKNQIFLANPDGTNAVALSLTGSAPLDIVDAPFFSPDGQSLFFSVPVPQQSYEPASPTWIEKILGVSVASAHVVPSEWWSAPLTGGAATQLTQIQAVGLFGSVSPDKKMIASYSGGGIFVMNPGGSGLTMLIKDVGGLPGTVSWIP